MDETKNSHPEWGEGKWRWVMEKEIGGKMEGEEREGEIVTNKDFLKTLYVYLLL